MAITSQLLARTAAATSSTTLYTVPNSSTTTIVTSIVLSNTSASTSTATILIDGVNLIPTVSIVGNSVAVFDMKQVIPANATPKTITGFASTTAVAIHISGAEVV